MAGALCIISLIAFFEMTKATRVHTEGKKINALEITGSVFIVLYYIGLSLGMALIYANRILHDTAIIPNNFDKSLIYFVIIFGIVIALIAFMFVYVFSFPKFKAKEVMAAYFEFIYAPVLLSFLFIIREGWQHGFYLVWLVFLCSWGSDTCAYCVGVLFGKHKMAPKLSPKKSIEGGIGGVVGAALLFGLYTYFVINPFSSEQIQMNLIQAMCLGAVGALISMVGDLAASAIKRDYEIKDYGRLIPGHGGIMDRFDSVIIVAPFIFFGLVMIA